MARRILDAVSTVIAGRAKEYMKGHVMVAFLLFLALPLLRIRSIPAFSGTWFLVHCVVFAAVLSGLGVLAVRGGCARLRLSAIDILVAGFYALYLAAAALSDNRELSFIELSGEIFMMALYVYFRVVVDGPSGGDFVEKLTCFAALAAVGLSLWGLAQYFFDVDVPRELKLLFKTHHFPVVASMGNPNFLAETIALFMLPALGHLSSRKNLVPLVGGAFVMGLAVFLTYSRLAWFATALALFLALAAAGGKTRRRLVAAAAVIVIGAGVFFVHHQRGGSTRSERVLRSFDLTSGSPLTERRIIYRAGLSMLRDAGLFGMGPGMFGYRYLDYQGHALRSSAGGPAGELPVDLDHAHNDLIETGVDLGYAALVLFVLLLGAAAALGARSLARPRPQGPPACLGLVPIVYIPFCLWSFPFHLPFSKIMLLLSLACIASRGRVIAGGRMRFRVAAPFLALLLAVFMVADARHALSVYHYDRGLSYFSRDFEKSFEHFRRGIECHPYNGYNYFSMGALFLNRGRKEGIAFLEESIKYFSSSTTRLYLARGNRDHGRLEDAVRWYEKLLFVRPDIRKAREEYRKILDEGGGR